MNKKHPFKFILLSLVLILSCISKDKNVCNKNIIITKILFEVNNSFNQIGVSNYNILLFFDSIGNNTISLDDTLIHIITNKYLNVYNNEFIGFGSILKFNVKQNINKLKFGILENQIAIDFSKMEKDFNILFSKNDIIKVKDKPEIKIKFDSAVKYQFMLNGKEIKRNSSEYFDKFIGSVPDVR